MQERFDAAVEDVLENINDINTEGKKQRKISIDITFKPQDKDRFIHDVAFSVKTGLQPKETISETMFSYADPVTGEMKLRKNNPNQIQFDFQPTVVSNTEES